MVNMGWSILGNSRAQLVWSQFHASHGLCFGDALDAGVQAGCMLSILAYSSICDHRGLLGQVGSSTGLTYNDSFSETPGSSMEGYRV